MKNQNETSSSNPEQQSSAAASCCAAVGSIGEEELKVYQAFIFSIPVFFTFVLLFSFYLFYLRRRRCRRQNGTSSSSSDLHLQLPTLSGNNVSRNEQGLKKELREMLPIVVFMESFSVRETQCSVCLGDYHAEDRLQQIPFCGHTFHMDCIDHWLASHTTCPLCRLSLLASFKEDFQTMTSTMPPNAGHSGETSVEDCYHTSENLQQIP